ncbi:general secretion pathway protein D [Thioalbus denitrificans]|uniref:General secretion pathway protein D n=1 Tax=Thioalbus denitrificans TaxID=547122 RepID=A0A369CC98_9GAMM|nr:general secretion pathway protein D [Thioalbus denitrificans]
MDASRRCGAELKGSGAVRNKAGVCRRLHPLLALLLLLLPLGQPPARAEAGGVTLNLVDADIQSFIGTVSELTGRNFVLDPRVKGKVTVVSSHEMDADAVYRVFLSVLQVHGYAAIPGEEVTKIVPVAEGKQIDTPVASDAAPGAGDEVVTRVVSVQHVSADQLVPLLRPLVPQQGHLAAYAPGNVIIVSDTAGNIGRLVKIIDRIDIESETGYEVIRLAHAPAAEVIRLLNSLKTPAGPAEPAGDRLVFAADERTNSILLSGDPASRLRIRTLVTHLDTPVEESGNTRVVYLHYAKAEELAPLLKSVSGSLVKEAGAAPAGPPGRSRVSIEADANTNALVITAPQEVLAALQGIIRQLDVRRAQVLVEAVIAEVSTDTAKELGIQWILDGTPGGEGPVGVINFGGSGSGIVQLGASIEAGNVPSLGDGLALGFGRFNSGSLNFAALIRALSGDAATNILSTPSLVTLDNEEAEIVVGQNVPFLTGSYTSIGDSGSTPTNPFQTIERKDVGLTLRIKPQINEGDSIRLEIEQEVSSLAASSIGAADVITNKRAIRTSVMVEDGRLLVLGGLMDESLQGSRQKVPGLGDIPLLGGLFRYDKTTLVKKNLMVFLHPVILRDGAMESRISGGKYNHIRARQLQLREEGVPMLPREAIPVLPEERDLLSRPTYQFPVGPNS